MRCIFFILFSLCSITTLLSQSTYTVSGKVIDSQSKEPLVFASIGIEGHSMGTVSNALGEFDFHIPRSLKDEKLVISMLGYENVQVAIDKVINRDTLIFKLNKIVKLLDEVVIQDSLSGGDIARIALLRIEENYPMEPYMLDGFYRDLKQVGGTYFSLLEAAVKIYDEGYEEPNNKFRLRERVALMEVRKSLGYNNRFTMYFDQTNLLEDLLLRNDVRYYRYPAADSFFDLFERLKTTIYDGNLVYVVYAQSPDFKLKMYIRTYDYAILRVEHERFHTEDNILKKKKDLVSKYVHDKKTIDFKDYKGTMYLSYMNSESQVNWYDEDTDSLQFETLLQQELLINKVYPNPEGRIRRTEKMRKYGLQYQHEDYNRAFWDSYNVIKQTPLDKEIITDLEQQGALEDQFENY